MTDDGDLEEYVEFIDDKYDTRIREAIVPRIETLEDERDEARRERAELAEQVDQIAQRMAVLEERLEGIAGLADDQETNPQKRVADLREAMIRRAEARGEQDGYERIAMWWREVQDLFADYGHGQISKPDCYKAMREAADGMPGFEMGTKANSNGNEVKAIRLDLAELRAETTSSDPTTAETAAADGGRPIGGPINGGE